MPFLQDVIHRLEVGGGMRYFRIGLGLLAIVLLTVLYNWRAFKNMDTQEAMDAAQLGRNLAQGKGYTTLFIRPFSMYLVKKRNREKQAAVPAGKAADLAQIKEMHPDIANPPLYPVALAALMKIAPFHYPVDTAHPFWSTAGRGGRAFWRYQPDFIIGLFNQALFFAGIVMVFFLARKLFDGAVAWLSAGLLLGSELFWRFSVSGLSTMLLCLIFLALVWVIVLLEQEARAPVRGPGTLLILAVLAGAVVGLGGLSRYSFAWLIIPVLGFLIVFGGPRRVVLALLALIAFMVVLGPWVVRNLNVSGAPFGTSTYAILESTYVFPQHRLERSLEPNLAQGLVLSAFWQKLIGNARFILQNDLPKLGGSWVTAFFLVGLLVAFRSPAVKRLRYFLLSCLLVLAITQALGRTHLSEDSPEVNTENLLVLLVPLTLVYGVSLFFLLLDQINMPFPQMRYIVIGLFSAIACLPLIFVFMPPRNSPVAYPPYFPPVIQNVSAWLKEKELIMSDIPWAVAWYGQRQCVWLTLKATPDDSDPNTHEDFLSINDYQKPINALYLTPQTLDSRFLSQWIQAGELSWGSFILEGMVKREIPPNFPLRKMPAGLLSNGQLVLTDWERWKK